jgi:hypothetical protein
VQEGSCNVGTTFINKRVVLAKEKLGRVQWGEQSLVLRIVSLLFFEVVDQEFHR